MRTETVACPLCEAPADRSEVVATGIDYEYRTSDETFQFVACSACGVSYLNPRPHAAELSTIYPPTYYSFIGEDEGKGLVRVLRAKWERAKVREYLRYLSSGRCRILDIGCGRGRLLASIRQLAPESELFGIELDPAAVAAARSLGFRVTQATIEEYQPAERFDLILMQQVIEHVASPRQVLRKLRQLLAPGGAVVIETPNLAGWDYRLFRHGAWGGYHIPRHWALFTRPALKRLAEEEGFEVIGQSDLMSLSFWSWSIHNTLQKRGLPARLLRAARPPNAFLLALTLPLEVLQRLLGLPTSNQRLVVRLRA